MSNHSAATVPDPSAARQGWQRVLLGQDRIVHLAPLAAVLLFLAAIVSAFWYLRLEEVRREQEAVKRDVEYSQQRLRLRLLERQEQLMRLARDMADREMSTLQFDFRAEALVTQFPELLALSWLDGHRQLRATQASPSVSPVRDWVSEGQLKTGDAETGFGLAKDLRQPVYTQPLVAQGTEPELYLHVPITPRGEFAGTLLAEYSVDGLLRYSVPAEVLAKYAVALLDAKGQLLAGQTIPDRQGLAELLPWAGKVNEFEIPVSPVGNGLVLRAQAWRTSQGVVGGTLFWLVAVLATMTAWMLIANWRQSQRRQQAQHALQAETSFRRAMENSMLTGMRALDLNGRITYVNPAFCQMTGWSEDELIGQTEPFSYWPPEDRDALSARLSDELDGGAESSGFQMRVQRKDGTVFDARLYVSPLIDATGKQTGWMASMTDITEPNRVRRQLSASYERFTTVLEALDASVSVAPLGSEELLFANKLYRQWFGATTGGHLGLVARAGTPQTQLADEGLDSVDSFAGLPLDSLATTPVAEQVEVYIERLDKWLEVRSRYLNWVDGRLAQMVIATDITARRHAQEQAAAQAERAQTASRLITMGEMASSVAHELNQPLTAISNYCTGMISRIKGGSISQDDLLGALDKTARQAQRAGQVVQHIRSFVKRSEPRREWAEVATMMEQVVELADIELRRRQIRLTHQIAPGLPAMYVDPILIEQVVINLIKNGAESIDAAQRVTGNRVVDLRVMQRDVEDLPTMHFSVTDSGRGLSPEALSRLYEAFFSTKAEGLGIGLNLCRSIIESHQGRISAENLYNAGQVVGCRFSFWIPVGPVPDALASTPNARTVA
ncbi:PAS domain S-box protein [Ottowia sp.]|uniref:PAS domain-containing sensor histidine kinase n=1 Tax=Ottowia sp. TaxID=1898956 RepID=UPI002CB8F830|nr:PAS domain S-box protein [Ottowia sp.]HOB66882.1 PAS domain S-box protein [Ottowia sp.]HPZ57771.1 PAS domain S-box protein [Ottowia sp.]HQD46639.1 PAS domain S-box protein [Ottowia sp.]